MWLRSRLAGEGGAIGGTLASEATAGEDVELAGAAVLSHLVLGSEQVGLVEIVVVGDDELVLGSPVDIDVVQRQVHEDVVLRGDGLVSTHLADRDRAGEVDEGLVLGEVSPVDVGVRSGRSLLVEVVPVETRGDVRVVVPVAPKSPLDGDVVVNGVSQRLLRLEKVESLTRRGYRRIATGGDVGIRHPSVLIAVYLVPNGARGVASKRAGNRTATLPAGERDGTTCFDLTDRLVLESGTVTDVDVPHLGGIEHRRGDVVRTRRRRRDHRSGDHQQHAHTERHQLSCFARLAHRDPPRAELRQSSDRNFDVLHDVLLASGGGIRVHPIRAPGAI